MSNCEQCIHKNQEVVIKTEILRIFLDVSSPFRVMGGFVTVALLLSRLNIKLRCGGGLPFPKFPQRFSVMQRRERERAISFRSGEFYVMTFMDFHQYLLIDR